MFFFLHLPFCFHVKLSLSLFNWINRRRKFPLLKTNALHCRANHLNACVWFLKSKNKRNSVYSWREMCWLMLPGTGRLRDGHNCGGLWEYNGSLKSNNSSKGCNFAVTIFSCDFSYWHKCGAIQCGNINTDKPITGRRERLYSMWSVSCKIDLDEAVLLSLKKDWCDDMQATILLYFISRYLSHL